MEKVLSHLKMFATLNRNHIRIGSEIVDDTNLRRVTISRGGKHVYGSKTYANMSDLNKAWIEALKYEYNKLNKK